MLQKYSFLFFFCLSTLFSTAQTDSLQQAAFESAGLALKDGGLVVLLPTKSKTIAAMEDLLTSGDLSKNRQLSLAVRLEDIKKDVIRDQEWIIELLDEYYTVGDLYFIYDHDWPTIKDSTQAGYFLNHNLDYDSKISSPEKFLILRKGTPDPAKYTVREAFILYDQDGQDLADPFPSIAGLAEPFLPFTITKEQIDFARYKRAIKKLSRNLKGVVNYIVAKQEGN